MKKYWPFIVFSLLHFLATAACFLVLTVEGMDAATGEDKVAVSPAMLLIAEMSLHVFMAPIGWLIFLNKSMALGVFLINSLIMGFSPIWLKKLSSKMMTR